MTLTYIEIFYEYIAFWNTKHVQKDMDDDNSFFLQIIINSICFVILLLYIINVKKKMFL